jgi:hypothetical protein
VSRITSILLRTPSFFLYSRSFVSLKVFDVTGREVAAIISGEVSAGNHAQQWSASDLPTGVYFYRLSVVPFARPALPIPTEVGRSEQDLVPTDDRNGQTSGNYETKKMILLR